MIETRDYGPGWRPVDRLREDGKVRRVLDMFVAAYAGWLVSEGGKDVVVGLMLLAFMAVSIAAPAHLRTRLMLAVAAVVLLGIAGDVIGLWG